MLSSRTTEGSPGPGPDAQLSSPHDVAAAVVFALGMPPGVEVRELIVTVSEEPSWP